jgi:hypothetical protein
VAGTIALLPTTADGTKFQVWEQSGNPPYPDNAEQECGPENASGQPVESGLCVP